jgi:hypothetical protein
MRQLADTRGYRIAKLEIYRIVTMATLQDAWTKKSPGGLAGWRGYGSGTATLSGDQLNSRMNSPIFGQIVSRQRRPEKMP